MKPRRAATAQGGVTTVEFAIVGLLVFVVLFGCLELSRALYTYNSLTEATRRGARLAAVCQLNHASIANVTALLNPDGSSQGAGLPNLTTSNVTVEYLNAAGAATASIPNVDFVRVSINNYQLALNIPLVDFTVTLPTFSTTLPRESLGLNPQTGVRNTC